MKHMRSVWSVSLALVLLAGCSSESETPGTSGAQSSPSPQVAQALPLLSVTTDTGVDVTSRDFYLPAQYVLKDESQAILVQGATEIRGRGHSTWDLMPKKPYHIKLGKSSSLLGMPANRHWALLANYSDKTMLRNDLVFKLGQWLGMEYTPRSRFVEVELNGVYLGIYQLTEHIRIAPDRVNIPELKIGDTTLPNITGGYLLEVDEWRDEAFCFPSIRSGMPFCLKNPETLLEPGWEAQRAYIVDYISKVEDAIFANNFDPVTGYAAYIDVDSAVQYYLANELVKNVDGDLRLSTYLYKKRDGKLTFGPLWDFDIAAGNVNFNGCDNPEGWYIRSAPWFARLFQDPAFAAKVKDKWNQLKSSGQLEELFHYIDNRATYLSQVQVKNFQKWDILSTWVWPNRVVTGSYEGEVTAMKDWLRARVNWMDAQFNP